MHVANLMGRVQVTVSYDHNKRILQFTDDQDIDTHFSGNDILRFISALRDVRRQIEAHEEIWVGPFDKVSVDYYDGSENAFLSWAKCIGNKRGAALTLDQTAAANLLDAIKWEMFA